MTIIGIDVDGVVADLHTEWLRRYNLDWDDNLKPSDIVVWDFETLVRPECGKKVYDYLRDPTLYINVKPIEGALEGIRELRACGDRVVFVTSNVKGMTDAKWSWLEQHKFLPSNFRVQKDLMVCYDKTLARVDVLVDDALHNVRAFPGNAILFDAPYNQEYSPDEFRVRSWPELVEMLTGEPEIV